MDRSSTSVLPVCTWLSPPFTLFSGGDDGVFEDGDVLLEGDLSGSFAVFEFLLFTDYVAPDGGVGVTDGVVPDCMAGDFWG